MTVTFEPADEAFRHEVRAFLAEALPPELAAATRNGLHLRRDLLAPWYRLLGEKGWAAHSWPAEFGGPGWPPLRRFIFESEYAAADAPPLSVFGVYLVGPTLYTFGSPAQKDRFLPPIRSGAELWCQGYSEAGAGSDLAVLRTTAKRTGSGWVISGQKMWTTEAHDADFMICLARTNTEVRPQAGLSLFIVPMAAKGVSVQPVLTMDEGHSVNTTFLDGVEVGADALIGEVDRGWSYAKFLLSHERTNNAQVHRSRREFERLRKRAAATPGRRAGGHRTVLDEPAVAARFAALATEVAALEMSVLRVLSEEGAGREPGPEASILKLEGSCLQQRIAALALDVLGEDGLSLDVQGEGSAAAEARGWVERHLFRRAVTVYAGSNEVQRNIIAKTVLGM